MVRLMSLFFAMLGLLTVLGIVPWLLLQGSGGVPGLTVSFWLLGWLPILAGVGLFLWCNGLFTFVGHGTLVIFFPPTNLVRAGPYTVVRNPMYLSLFLTLGGEAILFHSIGLAIFLLLLMVGIHLFVVFFEEPQLIRRYAESYQDYLRTVPRWLPRLRRRVSSEIAEE